LNVLVGRNGSGKSNVLRALTFLRDAMRLGLPGAVTHANGIDAVRRRSKGHPHNVRIALDLQLDGQPASYEVELTGSNVHEYHVKLERASVGGLQFEVLDGTFTGPENLRPNVDTQSLALTALGGDLRLRPLWETLANTAVYAINPSELRRPQQYVSETPMLSEGQNWVSVLHMQSEAGWKRDLVAALGKLTGDISDLRVTRAASFLLAEFQHAGDSKAKRWYPAERESDGTLRVAGILTALLQEPSLPVIGVEEPEQTVHPGALPILYDYLLEASTRSQVLVTTHSPSFLNHLDLERCRVFVVGRGEQGTQVRALTESQRRSVTQDLSSLGDLMLAGELQLELPWGESE
jgi:predicted ATPase